MYHGDSTIRGLGQVGGNETDLTEADARLNRHGKISISYGGFSRNSPLLSNGGCVCFFFSGPFLAT